MTEDHDHARPGIDAQQATLGTFRAILTGASPEAIHQAASSGSCDACTAVAAAWFGITIAQTLAGAGFVNGPLAPRLLEMITETEHELRSAGN